MHLRINKSSQVYRYWRICRERAGIRAILNQTAIVILAYLEDHGEAWQMQIAVENNLNQPNLSNNHMPNLVSMALVDYVERPGVGSQGGGRPAKIYTITDQGRRFLDLLTEYDARQTLLACIDSSPYFARVNSGIGVPGTLSE